MRKLYREKLRVIEAYQWFKNGDHPLDSPDIATDPSGVKIMGEGKIVGFYKEGDNNHYNDDFSKPCSVCNKSLKIHGSIEEQGVKLRVCPGSWIVTNKDSYKVMSNDQFIEQFELVEE